jgi:predicted metal-dependent peptidase
MKTDDPFADLEQAAKRQGAEDRAADHLSKARCKLILARDAKGAFFATLALKLKAEPDWGIDTMSTDGRRLKYNPDFVVGLDPDELVGVVAHEVMHNALAHHARRQGRDHKTWNLAADLAVNPLLLDAGYKLPACRVMPGKGEHAHLPPGLSAEEYYDRLSRQQGQDQPQGQDGDGDGEGQGPPDPGGCGGVQDAGSGSPAEQKQAEAEAKVDVAQAGQAARKRGALPAGLARLVEEIVHPQVDWREVLREFVTRHARNDYAWSPPNRRFVHQGLYLPGLRSEELGEVAVAVDTSGSIGEAELRAFTAEMQGILESFEGAELKILYHDTQVRHVQEWKACDGPLKPEPRGGGGTDHRPVFEYLDKQGQPPTCLVCLTDMYSCFPDREPPYPVLWCSTGGKTAPFGRLVEGKV